MAVVNSRTREAARVRIDYERCLGCGACARVCGTTLTMEGGRPRVEQGRLFGCIGCGQCAAACPADCLAVEGRTMTPADMVPLPPLEARAGFGELYGLMLARRSVRLFADREVDRETVDRVVAAASTAPVSIPPSDVNVWLLAGRAKVREFAFEFIDQLAAKKKWLFSPLVLALMRPFAGREAVEAMRDFVGPLVDSIVAARERGEDALLYGAPLVMVFQGSPYASPADPMIAATYATLAAEALGLGSCMIGTVVPFLRQNKRLAAKYGVRPNGRDGLAVVFGYPAVEYRRAVRRTFANVDFG
jgi:ferredoxin